MPLGIPALYNNFPDLKNSTRKRKILGEDEDYSVPNINQNIQGTNSPNLLSKILEAVSSGFAVGLSDNPGQVLMQQLTQRRQEAMQKQQMEYDRQIQKEQRDFQREMKIKEQQFTKEENVTERTFKKEQQAQNLQDDILLSDIRFTQNQQLQKENRDARLNLQKLQTEFQATEGQKNRDWQGEFEKIKSTNDLKQIEIKTVMAALLSSSKYHNAAPISEVMRIVDKLDKGIALTKNDTAIIDKSIKLNAVATSRSGGGGGSISQGTKFQQKNYSQLQDDRNEVVKQLLIRSNEPMLNPDGSIMRDLGGKPILKYASREELMQRVGDAVGIYDSVTGFGQQQQKTVQEAQGGITQSELNIMNNINRALDSGISESDIEFSINNDLKGNPQLQKQARQLLKQRKSKFKIKAFGQ